MALPDGVYKEAFDNAKKCKVEWKINSYELSSINECYSGLKLNVQNDSWTYSIYWTQMYFIWCADVWATFPLLDINNNPIYPKPWDSIYAIVDSKSNNILKIWRDIYNSHLEIPYCSWSIILPTNKEVNNFTLTKNNYVLFWVITFLLFLVLFLIYKLHKSKK